MTRERREEVVIIALAVSVAIHVGLMLTVKTRVMTEVVPQSARVTRHGPMRVEKREPMAEPVQIASVEDVSARKDAPAVAEMSSAPLAPAPSAGEFTAEIPKVEAPKPVMLEHEAAVFDTSPVGLGKAASTVVPITRIETPKAAAEPVAKPDFAASIPAAVKPAAPVLPIVAKEPDAVLLPAKIVWDSAPKVSFTPASEVYAKVDEKVVAAEKQAVRSLVETDDAADLVKFVNLTMTAATANDGWRYFKVMMTPRTDLKTVPKDVVMVIDGSGSIGNDRLGRCRAAARRILRTATNTGDRFNLVVFRNAFSYAFKTWRECDADSFAEGERWLSKQTSHGRTDVFSTISSVLTLPRDPKRPLIALVVTDGDANSGVSDTADILSRFTALNDGLVSVYMYGVKSSANRELIDVLTRGNRGESFVFEGWRWNTGEGMETLSERFRDPVLSDLRIVFTANSKAEAYPRLLRNLYRGGILEFYGRVPSATKELSFSLKGLNGDEAYEGFFKLPFATAPSDPAVITAWQSESAIDRKLR